MTASTTPRLLHLYREVPRLLEIYFELADRAVAWARADQLANLRADQLNGLEVDSESYPGMRAEFSAKVFAEACDREAECDKAMKATAKRLVAELMK